MSDLRIELTDRKTCKVSVTVFPMGNYLSEGRTDTKVKAGVWTYEFSDCPQFRKLCSDLMILKTGNYNGLVPIQTSSVTWTLDSSIWRDLADAMFAFTLHLDIGSEMHAVE